MEANLLQEGEKVKVELSGDGARMSGVRNFFFFKTKIALIIILLHELQFTLKLQKQKKHIYVSTCYNLHAVRKTRNYVELIYNTLPTLMCSNFILLSLSILQSKDDLLSSKGIQF